MPSIAISTASPECSVNESGGIMPAPVSRKQPRGNWFRGTGTPPVQRDCVSSPPSWWNRKRRCRRRAGWSRELLCSPLLPAGEIGSSSSVLAHSTGIAADANRAARTYHAMR